MKKDSGLVDETVSNRDAEGAISYHNRLAEGWDARYLSGSFGRRAAFFANCVVPKMANGGYWLDAGCGSGFFARMLANTGRTVVGVDGSREMISAAKKSVPPGVIDFQVVPTIEALPFNDRSFDGAICLSVLEYLSSPHAALSETARVLRRGGTLVVSIPNTYSAIRLVQRFRSMLPWSNEDSGANYLATSRFTVTRNSLREALQRNSLECTGVLSFDPLIPRLLHRVIPPSLLFAIARKI